MTGLGLLAAVAAAFGWSGLDAARKVLVRDLDPLAILVFLGLGQVPLFAAWAAWQAQWFHDPLAYAPLGALAVGLNVAANFFYLLAVRASPLSLVIPLLAFVPVLTVGVANPVLGELPQPGQLVGIAFVVLGALGLHADAAPSSGPWGLLRALLRERGSAFMLLTAALWATGIVVDKLALRHASVGAHALVVNGGIGVLAAAWLLARGRGDALRGVRARPLTMLGAIGAATLGMGGQLLAIGWIFTGVVEAVKRAVGMAASVVVGRVAFGEPLHARKVVAVVVMAGGTTAIVLSSP